jgi:hypothetical protein
MYEAARQRYAEASAGWTRARDQAERLVLSASEELDAAEAELRGFESRPGIALPECQERLCA